MTNAFRITVVFLLCSVAAMAQSSGEQSFSPYSPLAKIDRGNITRLRVAWTYRTGEPLTPVEGGGRPPAFEATPVYVDGLLYLGTPYGKVIALDPETGTERWTFDAKIDRTGNYGDFANRGVTAWLDVEREAGAACRRRIFFASIDARLFALDAATGKPCADFGSAGSIDLKTGLRRKPKHAGEYQQTSPPAVVAGVVVVGSAIADNSRIDMASGEVRGFDARSGKPLWSWDPLPDNPEAGAANAWSRIVADPERKLVFIPTGSASPDYYGGKRAGDNRHANSVVALRASTGEMIWNFQTVHHDLWDYDVASPPVLLSVIRDGQSVAAVAIGSKTGHIFIVDRETGKPLFGVEERAVPGSDADGEKPSATQPFPVAPPSLVPQKLALNEVWGPTPADQQSCKDQMADLRNEGIFTPASVRGSVIVPGNVGGLHWGGMAPDPLHDLLIAPANSFTAVAHLVPRNELEAWRKSHPDWETTDQDGAPYAFSRTWLRSPSGLPCNPPPFGTLSAVDTATGKLRWQVPLGQLPFAAAKPEWGSINLGGPLVTGGGLVFIGASMDPAFRAFDVETGRQLWKGELPASARSTPMTFEGPDAKQYVVIAAGGHEKSLGKLDNALVAFRLP